MLTYTVHTECVSATEEPPVCSVTLYLDLNWEWEVQTLCDMSNRHVSHGRPMDVVQSAYTPSIEWNFHDLFILLLASGLANVRQFLLKQTQLKSVMFGQLHDTDVPMEDVMDTVKVLKCYSGIAT